MRTLTSIILLSLSIAACGGPSDYIPAPVIDRVEPGYGVTGRTQTVVVRGEYVNWTQVTAADVSLGDGVSIDSLVASREDLTLEVTVDAAATLGYRDVTVHKRVLTAGFEIVPPFEVVSGASVQPAQFFHMVIQGRDTNWADGVVAVQIEPTGGYAAGDGQVLTSGTVAPAGFPLELSTTSPSKDVIEIEGFTDILAPPGKYDVVLSGEGFGDRVEGAVTVEAVDCTPLEPNGAVAGVAVGLEQDVLCLHLDEGSTVIGAELFPGADASMLSVYTSAQDAASGRTSPVYRFAFAYAGAFLPPLPEVYSPPGGMEVYVTVSHANEHLSRSSLEFNAPPFDAAYVVSNTTSPHAIEPVELDDGVDTLVAAFQGERAFSLQAPRFTVGRIELQSFGGGINSSIYKTGELFTPAGAFITQPVVVSRDGRVTLKLENLAPQSSYVELAWSEAPAPSFYQEMAEPVSVGGAGFDFDTGIVPVIRLIPMEVTGAPASVESLTVFLDVESQTCGVPYVPLSLSLIAPNGATSAVAVTCGDLTGSYGSDPAEYVTVSVPGLQSLEASPANGTWKLKVENGGPPATVYGWGLGFEPTP